METTKDILNFCNAAVFYDYTNIGIVCELKQVRRCIINIFYKTIPDGRFRVSLSIFDDVIFKINDNDVEIVLEKIHDLREKLLYMLAFEKKDRDEQQKLIVPFLNDDEKKHFKENEIKKRISLLNIILSTQN